MLDRAVNAVLDAAECTGAERTPEGVRAALTPELIASTLRACGVPRETATIEAVLRAAWRQVRGT